MRASGRPGPEMHPHPKCSLPPSESTTPTWANSVIATRIAAGAAAIPLSMALRRAPQIPYPQFLHLARDVFPHRLSSCHTDSLEVGTKVGT